jgi:hypothetical protein
MVTQLLVMKGKESHSMEGEHEEHKDDRDSDSKGEKLGDSSTNNTLSASSSITFKVEAKHEISIYDNQVNSKKLNSWLTQLEVHLGLYQIKEAQHIFFSHLKMTRHALLWWESYADALWISKKPMVMKCKDFKALSKSQFFLVGYEKEQLMKWQ